MSGERYADRATTLLKAYLQTNLPTYLRAVETAQSLDENTLVNPVAYLDYLSPDDYRSPEVQVWFEDDEPEDHDNNIEVHTGNIALLYAGDANLQAGQLAMRRYATALKDLIKDNPTLGGQSGIVYVYAGTSMQVSTGADSTVWHEIIVRVLARLVEA